MSQDWMHRSGIIHDLCTYYPGCWNAKSGLQFTCAEMWNGDEMMVVRIEACSGGLLAVKNCPCLVKQDSCQTHQLIHNTNRTPACIQHHRSAVFVQPVVCHFSSAWTDTVHEQLVSVRTSLCLWKVSAWLTWQTQYSVSFSYSSEALESECVSHRHLETTRIAWPFFCPNVTCNHSLCIKIIQKLQLQYKLVLAWASDLDYKLVPVISQSLDLLPQVICQLLCILHETFTAIEATAQGHWQSQIEV